MLCRTRNLARRTGRLTANLRNHEYFGFVDGHTYLSSSQLEELQHLALEPDPQLVVKAECQLAQLATRGHAAAFASARMALYATLRALGIGPGDEVIVTAFTCAVVCTAVRRTGARIVYCDIDAETFGTSPDAAMRIITPATKAIVAQHSFGIPCDIKALRSVADTHGITLIEDCALAVGSTVDGAPVGSYGDAAIFSTDHSKPLNSLIGGFACTDNADLALAISALQGSSEELAPEHQRALLSRVLLETRLARPEGNSQLAMRDFISDVRSHIHASTVPFLLADATPDSNTPYPYPARLPAFLAYLVLQELARWPETAARRRVSHAAVDTAMREIVPEARLPSAVTSAHNMIIPHRYALSVANGAKLREQLAPFIAVDWTWFLEPIVATPAPLSSFGYQASSCPTAETLGRDMINIPLPLSAGSCEILVAHLHRALAIRADR
jgi:perosamine synthetase